jgi:DNA-binding transcriptional LysR family regulator
LKYTLERALESPRNIPLVDVMLRRLKFKPLLIFDRVLASSSIARAAKELNLTQPAVTKAIQELESDLGVELFERTNRGVVPTCYGTLLGGRVKSVIAELRHLTDELNSFRSGESGHVIVGTLISASARLLPIAIAKLKLERPGVLVTVREGSIDRLFPALATGELDVVVGRLPEADLPLTRMFSFEHTVLYEEALCATVWGEHTLTRQKKIILSDLLDWPWILPLMESPARLTAEKLFFDAGLSMPHNIVESLSLLTNIGMMQSMQAITLMPRTVAQHFAQMKLLSILELGDIGQFGKIGYSVRGEKASTPAANFFIACLKSAAAEL